MKRTLSEKVCISMDQFATHSRSRQPPQSFSLVSIPRGNSNLLDLIHRHSRRPPQPLGNYLRADTLLYMFFYFLQYFSCQHNDGGSAVANFGILRARYVGQDACSGVNYVEKLQKDLDSTVRAGE